MKDAIRPGGVFLAGAAWQTGKPKGPEPLAPQVLTPPTSFEESFSRYAGELQETEAMKGLGQVRSLPGGLPGTGFVDTRKGRDLAPPESDNIDVRGIPGGGGSRSLTRTADKSTLQLTRGGIGIPISCMTWVHDKAAGTIRVEESYSAPFAGLATPNSPVVKPEQQSYTLDLNNQRLLFDEPGIGQFRIAGQQL